MLLIWKISHFNFRLAELFSPIHATCYFSCLGQVWIVSDEDLDHWGISCIFIRRLILVFAAERIQLDLEASLLASKVRWVLRCRIVDGPLVVYVFQCFDAFFQGGSRPFRILLCETQDWFYIRVSSRCELRLTTIHGALRRGGGLVSLYVLAQTFELSREERL